MPDPDSTVAAAMVTSALRPIGQVTAWIVWQSMRVSLYEDLAQPRPPAGS